MKITKKQLKKIIREEYKRLIESRHHMDMQRAIGQDIEREDQALGNPFGEMKARIISILPELMRKPSQESLSDSWFDWQDTGVPEQLGLGQEDWEEALFSEIENKYGLDPYELFGI